MLCQDDLLTGLEHHSCDSSLRSCSPHPLSPATDPNSVPSPHRSEADVAEPPIPTNGHTVTNEHVRAGLVLTGVLIRLARPVGPQVTGTTLGHAFSAMSHVPRPRKRLTAPTVAIVPLRIRFVLGHTGWALPMTAVQQDAPLRQVCAAVVTAPDVTTNVREPQPGIRRAFQFGPSAAAM